MAPSMSSRRSARAVGICATLLVALRALPVFVGTPQSSRLAERGAQTLRHADALNFDNAGALGDGGTTPLMLASHNNDVSEIRGYVENGADINGQDAYGWTAVRYAVRSRNYEAVEALIEMGANLNLQSNTGRTPLMSAAANGCSNMVKLLLKSGANTKVKNTSGMTAYEISMRGGETGCSECRKMLEAA
ncbi:unnamed protein product [Polarella glacialis]|uniref:Uncharacterized protein n=1 Tax=Polarella glacialis TaxID=89957 RepID=A0A813DQL0_POLGL|nr:unnamed protein product [Polarella glacialis]